MNTNTNSTGAQVNWFVGWIRKHLNPLVPDCRLPGHLSSQDCLIDQDELRAGFRAAWAAKDYQTIISIAN